MLTPVTPTELRLDLLCQLSDLNGVPGNEDAVVGLAELLVARGQATRSVDSDDVVRFALAQPA